MDFNEWIEFIDKGMKEGRFRNKCWCGSPLYADDLEGYPHDGGWTVDNMRDKQWLYIPCRKCGYGRAIWKLGVKRE